MYEATLRGQQASQAQRKATAPLAGDVLVYSSLHVSRELLCKSEFHRVPALGQLVTSKVPQVRRHTGGEVKRLN